MSSDRSNPNTRSYAQKTNNGVQSNNSPVAKKKTLFCDICKMGMNSESSMLSHEAGKKHQKLLRKQISKAEKKGKKSVSVSSSSDFCDSFQSQSSIPPETNHSNSDVANRTRNYYQCYRRNNYFQSNNFHSPNNRGRFSYKPKNYYRNQQWKAWPNQPYQNTSNPYNYHPSNTGYEQDPNYDYNNQPGILGDPSYLTCNNNWNDSFNQNFNIDYSENILPGEYSGEYTNDENHSSNNQNYEEVVKSTTDEPSSPSKKSREELDKNPDHSSDTANKESLQVGLSNKAVLNEPPSNTQQDKSKVLSENMTGKRIAHWINPSNFKDIAEVKRLVTEFSKSKKKENLIKLKLQTDKGSGNNSDHNSPEEINAALDLTPLSPKVPESDEASSEPNLNAGSSIVTNSSSEPRKRQHSKYCTGYVSDSSTLISPSSRRWKKTPSTDKPTKRSQNQALRKSLLNDTDCESFSSKKRKDSVNLNSVSKRHRCSSAECLEECISNVVSQKDVPHHVAVAEAKQVTSLNVAAVHQDIPPQSEAVYIKNECLDTSDLSSNNLDSLNLHDLIQKQSSCPDNATMTPVESLINLFASGNITVKREFDDPLIDAIRSLDPALLNKVCENEPEQNNVNQAAVSNTSESVASNPASVANSSLLPPNCAPALTVSLKNILNELQNISGEEEQVKNNIQNADRKIQEYQALLDEWKTMKIKFQIEEEILRNKRNTLVKTMNDLVMQQNAEDRLIPRTESPRPEEMACSSVPCAEVANSNSNSSNNSVLPNSESTSVQSSCPETNPPASNETIIETLDIDTDSSTEDDIAILPVPESEITVIDLDQTATLVKKSTSKPPRKRKSSSDIILENSYKLKDVFAHSAVVNCIQVYEGFLYTCGNDRCAKKFSLKDPTQIMIYPHSEKNISQLCVERMRGKTYIFTMGSSSSSVSVFNVEEEQRINCFNFGCNVASMCRGKGKIYIALRNGSIVTSDWKEYKQLVNICEPIRTIASTLQGGLNVLVTLSTNGHVSIRDADRSGLLIRYVKALAHVPLYMAINNDCVYLSSAGFLSILDISNGTFVKKYEVPAAYTSLTVYRDHIFTTSFSGFVRCYSKFEIGDVKAYYGAGKIALTCIHVHEGWVFTGNRTGEVSVFRYDPDAAFPCQFGKCDIIFGSFEDLALHISQGKDHVLPSSGSRCPWGKCHTVMRKNWDKEAIRKHIQDHVYSSLPNNQESMYKITI